MKQDIGKRVGWAFGVVVVIMIAAAIFSLIQLHKSAAAFRGVSENEMTAALAAFGIRANFDEMVWATKNILLRGEDRDVLSNELKIFEYKKDRLENIWQPMLEKILRGPDINDEQRKLYDDFKKEYADFLDAWGRALPVYKARGRAAADAIIRGKGRKACDCLVELVRSLRQQALNDMEAATARTKTAVTTMLVAFVFSVVIVVIAVVYIFKGLTMAIERRTASRSGKD